MKKKNTLVPRPVQVNSTCFYNLNFTNYNLRVKDLNIFSNRAFHTKVRASNRIGPHNVDIISVIFASLLGDGYASARTIEGTRFSFLVFRFFFHFSSKRKKMKEKKEK